VVVVGMIIGLGTMVGVCKVLARSGLCNFGGRKFTGEGRVDDSGEKRLSWMRLGGIVPGNFGAGNFMAGGGKKSLFGRRYDEKGVERNPLRKVVTFEDEDEEKVVDISPEFVDEPGLAYQPLSKNASSAVSSNIKPGLLPDPRALIGLRVGQTLHPAHFTTTPHLSPTSFFDNEDHIVSASPSGLSCVSTAHSRTKSAPVMVGDGRRESNKSSAVSSASSEWDIARAYGGPRYERARSVGAMSGLSADERDWERLHRISESTTGKQD